MISLAIYFVIIVISVSEAGDVATGKNGIIIATDAGTCKMDYKNSKTSIEIKDISKDKKGVNAFLDIPTEINDKLLLFFSLDKKIPGGWQKGFMKLSGPACNKSIELAPGLLKKLSDRSSPKYDVSYPWKKGQTSIENFPNILDRSDMKLPSYPYGDFKITYLIKDTANKVILCIEIFATIKKP